MVLEVIKIFGGSFEGEVLYENTKYVSPNDQRREMKLANLNKVANRVAKKNKQERKLREEDSLEEDSDWEPLLFCCCCSVIVEVYKSKVYCW